MIRNALNYKKINIFINKKSSKDFLYVDEAFEVLLKVIKKGKTVIKLAKDAPAPRAINIAGKAQQIKVEDDANNEKKFVAMSFSEFLVFR